MAGELRVPSTLSMQRSWSLRPLRKTRVWRWDLELPRVVKRRRMRMRRTTRLRSRHDRQRQRMMRGSWESIGIRRIGRNRIKKLTRAEFMWMWSSNDGLSSWVEPSCGLGNRWSKLELLRTIVLIESTLTELDLSVQASQSISVQQKELVVDLPLILWIFFISCRMFRLSGLHCKVSDWLWLSDF